MGSHLVGKPDYSSKGDSDVVIVLSYRTPITKGGRGSFKDINSDVILKKLTQEFVKKLPLSFDVNLIEDIIIGNVLNPGAGVNEHRAALLAAGLPLSIPFMAVNRQCSSGLMAVNDIANKIKLGQISCGLAGGAESMSQNYGMKAIPKISDEIKNDKEGGKCLIPMGITSENVASQFSVSREKQDAFAAESYQKAELAIRNGLFEDEILPIEIEVEEDDDDDDEDDNKKSLKKTIVVSKDEGPRLNVTAQSLSKIRPAFKGSTTAGNASQVSDGAALCLLMTRKLAKQLGLPILAKYIETNISGVPPEIMGVGPAVAIPNLLTKTGISKDEIAIYEINEAFASQCLYCIEKVGLDAKKVNPKGGAIALGHPLGCTGARQVATLLRQLQPGEYGVVSMCIGTGMGAASLFIKE